MIHLRFAAILPGNGPDTFAAAVLAALRQVEGLHQVSPGHAQLIIHLSPEPAPPLTPEWGVWTLHSEPRGRFLRQNFVRQTTPTGTRILESHVVPASIPPSESLSLLAEAPARLCRLLLAGVPLPTSEESLPAQPPKRPWHPIADQIRNTLLTEIWHAGLVHAPIERFLDPGFHPHVEWLPNANPHHFFADPFLAPASEGLRVLVEEYDYLADPVGRIAEFAWRDGRFQLPPRRIFPSSAHMSYPFLFSADGALCCIPESWQQNRIRLHRLDPRTGLWDEGVNLIEGIPAVDSTIIRHEDRWWLFCTEKGPGVDCRLLLWHAERLEGPWSPHRANPVKVDVRSARPGGTPFLAGGALYRPAQDCSESYGCRLALNRVTRLSPTGFAEETVRVLAPWPDWPFSDGLHTLSAAGDWTILDAKRMTFLPHLAKRRILHKLRRLGGLAAARKD